MRLIKSAMVLVSAVLLVTVLWAGGNAPAFGADQYKLQSILWWNPGVTVSQMDSYMASVRPDSPLIGRSQMWINAGNKYGIDPAFMMALAINESGWGTSEFAQNEHNLYGWGAYDDGRPAKYFNTWEDGTDYVAGEIARGYLTPGGWNYSDWYGPTLAGMFDDSEPGHYPYATSRTEAGTLVGIMNAFASRTPGYNYPGIFGDYYATYVKVDVPSTMIPGRPYQISLRLDNDGRTLWPKDGDFRLSYSFADNYDARISMPCDIGPGGKAVLSFPVTAPPATGTYHLKFDLVKELEFWFSWKYVPKLDVTVNVAPANADDVTYPNVSPFPNPALAGWTYSTTDITVYNIGSASWPDSNVRLGYRWLDAHTGVDDPDWGRTLLGGDLDGGQQRTLHPTIRTPPNPGYYVLKQDMVREGAHWFSNPFAVPPFTPPDDWGGSPTTSALIWVVPPHPNGSVIRTASSPDVYFLEGGQKRPVVSPAAFTSHGFRWDRVVLVAQSEVDSYPLAAPLKARPGALLRGSDGKVYVTDLSGGTYQRRWINSPQVFDSLGYRWEDVIGVPDAELDEYANQEPPISEVSVHRNGSLVKTASSPDVYFLEGGQKRLVVSPAAFTSHGFRWDRVILVSQSELDGYGVPGAPLRARPGALLRGSDGKVYVTDLSGGTYQRRWINSPELFRDLGYRWEDVIGVQDAELSEYQPVALF